MHIDVDRDELARLRLFRRPRILLYERKKKKTMMNNMIIRSVTVY